MVNIVVGNYGNRYGMSVDNRYRLVPTASSCLNLWNREGANNQSISLQPGPAVCTCQPQPQLQPHTTCGYPPTHSAGTWQPCTCLCAYNNTAEIGAAVFLLVMTTIRDKTYRADINSAAPTQTSKAGSIHPPRHSVLELRHQTKQHHAR